jgi:hypothetical protein
MADQLPAPYGDEIKGISQATGLPLGELNTIPYNLSIQIEQKKISFII